MRKSALLIPVLGLFLAFDALAHKEMNLPPGPIKDRHELMEGIGDNAKKIGDALKTNDAKEIAKVVPPAASAIAVSAHKIVPLFPPGSTDPKSRAKPEIWQDFPKFEASAKDLAAHAEALATTAKTGDAAAVGAAAKVMFGDCKGCHDAFRMPDEKEK